MNKLLYLLLLVLFSKELSAQNIGVAYYSKKSNISTAFNFNQSLNSKTIAKDIESLNFELKFNKNLASYKQSIDIYDEEKKIALVLSGYSGPYFFDFEKRSLFRKKGKYLIEKKFDSIKWTLTNEKFVINNFTCYKAIADVELEGRTGKFIEKAIAWYTPEININAGPDGFGGLPGLIIQLEFKKSITTLNNIQFSNKPITIKPPKYKKLMLEHDFKALTKDLVENRVKYYKN